jgi:integrase
MVQPKTRFNGQRRRGIGKPKRIFYIAYWRGGRKIEEKAGREKADDMTAYNASILRSAKIDGKPSRHEEWEAAKAVEEGRWTFDRLWQAWKEANPTKSGRVNDDNRYRNHLKNLFGDKEPREIVPLDVDRLRVRMQKAAAPPPGRKRKKPTTEKKPYAIGTIKSVFGLLTRIANFGVKRQLCEGLRFKLESPRGGKEKTEDMDAEQMAMYIKTCREWPDPQAGAFALLALYTGMRKSEVRKLKWTDIDAQGFILLRDPKGGKDQKIPLSDTAAELLRTHPRDGKNLYVFAGERSGGPRAARHIAESSRAIRDAAGLPKDFQPLHGLRHTFASHLASSGEVDLYTLSKLLTHADTRTTQRYAHLRDETLKKAPSVAGRIIRETTVEQDAKKGARAMHRKIAARRKAVFVGR